MSYTPTNWVDGETPVNAENLNKLEQAAQANDAAISEINTAREAGEFKGDSGADGYTPVRGVDYWTDADKAEIIAAVLAELDGSGGGDEPGEGAAAITVDVYSEDNYGEAPVIDVSERGNMIYVSSEIPTLAQINNCYFNGIFGESEVTFSLPGVEEISGGYMVTFKSAECTDSGDAITDCSAGMYVAGTSSAYGSAGIYVNFGEFETWASAVTGYNSALYQGTIYFPEV